MSDGMILFIMCVLSYFGSIYYFEHETIAAYRLAMGTACWRLILFTIVLIGAMMWAKVGAERKTPGPTNTTQQV
jgi:hypothetical protein